MTPCKVDEDGNGETDKMGKIVSLMKRRGFIFKSSDIYGGLNGFFDYGPLGVELRRNIKDAWWTDIVRKRSDIVGLDCSVISHPKVWEASGHIAEFSDPMVDCRESKMRFRADQLFFAEIVVDSESIGYVCVPESDNVEETIEAAAESLRKKSAKPGKLGKLTIKPVSDASADEIARIPSPITGTPGALTLPRAFNLMFQNHVGAVADDASIAYLRPETAQGIFINFGNVIASTRVKIPFGIAQIGKSFRNEITPRNFIFRSREFEQMELEFFIDGKDETWKFWHKYWVDERLKWHKSIGIRDNLLGIKPHKGKELAHYARACSDITFEYPFGAQELEGIAARGCFDLTTHQNFSGKSMEYFDEVLKSKYIPHVIEPAVSVDRILLAAVCSAYCEEKVGSEVRTVMKFSPRIAPIKAAIFPLIRNNAEIVAKAEEMYGLLQRRWNVYYDSSGAIGRRYRRMDEIGTPYCVTVDFESLSNGTVTVRDRDSMEQERLPVTDVVSFIDERCL
jgi:glycyl-tRNA synthetase